MQQYLRVLRRCFSVSSAFNWTLSCCVVFFCADREIVEQPVNLTTLTDRYTEVLSRCCLLFVFMLLRAVICCGIVQSVLFVSVTSSCLNGRAAFCVFEFVCGLHCACLRALLGSYFLPELFGWSCFVPCISCCLLRAARWCFLIYQSIKMAHFGFHSFCFLCFLLLHVNMFLFLSCNLYVFCYVL